MPETPMDPMGKCRVSHGGYGFRGGDDYGGSGDRGRGGLPPPQTEMIFFSARRDGDYSIILLR